MAVREFTDRQRGERRLYLLVALMFVLVVFAGFGRTYYLKAFFGTPALPGALVHIHGLAMTAWVLLFSAQVWFIRSRNIKLHQKLGYVAIGLAILVIVTGIPTAIAAAKYGSNSSPPDIPPMVFMVVPFFDIVVFAILFAAAIYYRRNAANHKRLMLLTVLNFMPPAIARIPYMISLGPVAFFGIPDALAIGFLTYDTWKNRKLNKVFLFGTLLLIASHPLRIIIGGTEAWLSFAAWATS